MTLDDARRRIDQLEAALLRRTELLEQKQSELLGIKSSKAFQVASTAQKAIDRLLPLHTKRRTLVKVAARKLLAVPSALWQTRRAKHGPPPSQRYESETTPPEEYRRWIAKREPTPRQLGE